MKSAKKNLLQRVAVVIGVTLLIAVGYALDYGYWCPTSDVFILPGGLVWAIRMYYVESLQEDSRSASKRVV